MRRARRSADEPGVLGGLKTLLEDGIDLGHVPGEHSGPIQPEAGEHLAPDDTPSDPAGKGSYAAFRRTNQSTVSS